MTSMLRRVLVLSSLGGLTACQPDLLSGAPSDREDPGALPPAEISAQAARIPRITSVVPSVASNLGGTVLTVNGRSFDSGTQVFMDGKPVEFAGLLSSTQLSVQLPRGVYKAGPVTLKVVNGDGRQSERSDVLTLFAETAALVGQRVPVSLSGLASGARVTTTGDFNGDGLPDVLAQDYVHLYVLLARGRGMYSEPLTTDLPSGAMTSLVDVGDVNGV